MRRDPDWPMPKYAPGPHDDIFALGVISLNYCHLEHMFSILFGYAVGMTEVQVRVLFQRLQNDSRLKVLAQLTGQRDELPAEFKELVKHFAAGYEICAVNRNSIMHSHSGGLFRSESRGTAGILLTKFTRSGDELVSPVDLHDLRRVADEIHTYTMFGASLGTDLHIFRTLHARGETYEPSPLSDRPPLPLSLDWRPLSEFQAQARQPEPSQG
ncbi:hypothetical protein [Mesorhizobium sp. Cs1321R2N1]|uniref:hypothetical protein n=1 Tax=Mesorhizobium sp. Cs1321R2N1 TaxID=3015174 RepID=UPI00301E17BC